MATKVEASKGLKISILAGHVVECFDATLYGFFAVLLAPIFFPDNTDPMTRSWLAFWAGFAVRPLGALVFGTLGDRIGRRIPLLMTMAGIGLPTLIIAFLPTYEAIGMWSAVTLFLCRLFQGFFYGAESAGINLFLFETYKKSLGLKTGILTASGALGAAVAGGLGAFFVQESMPVEYWRVPFFIGGISAFLVFLWRRQISETEVFKKTQQENTLLPFPVLKIFTHHFPAFLVAMILTGFMTVPLYLSTTFGNQIFRDIGYTYSQSMLLNTGTFIVDGLILILYGRLADYLGFGKQVVLGCFITGASAIPAFLLISGDNPSLLHVLGFISLLTTSHTCFVACTMPFVSSFFPANCRYSGVALAATIGGVIVSGVTPLVAHYLTQVMGTKIAPAFWLISIAFLSIIGVSHQMRQRDLPSKKNQIPMREVA